MPDSNTILHYIYRDASNYKATAQTIFAGQVTPADKERLETALDDGHFIAWQVGLEDAREVDDSWSFGTNEDDHCWNEIVELRDTDHPPTDPRTITQFIDQVCAIDFWEDATDEDEDEDEDATDRLLNDDGEMVVALANGYTLRSGAEDRISGEYVRLCDPDGFEVMHWHHEEWEADPVMVMGAILNTAAGLLVDGLEHVSYFVESGEGEQLTEPTANRAEALAEAKRLCQRFIAEDTEGTHLVYDYGVSGGATEDDTTTYLPWADGEAVGFACLVDGKTVGDVYLNPAGDSGNGPEVAVYVAADPHSHDRGPVMVLEATPEPEDG